MTPACLLSAESSHPSGDRFCVVGCLGVRYWIGDDPMTGSVPFRWASPGKWSGLGACEIGEAREYTADRRETVFVCVVCPTAFGVGRDVFHALDMFAGISQRAVCERCCRSA